MIILDTNVISEMMKVNPHPAVVAWFKEQGNDQLYLTTLTVAEIRYGISTLPKGKRKSSLETNATYMFSAVFADRIVSFDYDAACYYAMIHALRNDAGKTITVMDAEIASICKSNSAALATRNTRDFTNLHIKLINPWD
jgi:predicted nucleic acid-binding protein